ncbi:hypothetical protein PPERSA_03465 [Pseudocohnilembus persalinus]|uniref:Uncharacterized protein n=1 Tax=Pseudocohnilembus persalinus TaxID=266149 RepID=A0A0V0QBU1_PSEPJ|nr:hypothetical protein PPERSA_03465 [Pseudocohnilembus persalinus]|eukprot:KRW99664.1 hypothetical protein PPERSA_03465 [Pseudocohnilembus persalinus]
MNSNRKPQNQNKPRPVGLAKKLIMQRHQPKGEDPFKKDEFPTLKEIALDIVAQNFHIYPDLIPYKDNKRILEQKIPIEEEEQIIEKTSTQLPIVISANNIQQESYWERACNERWKTSKKPIKLEDHGLSWKTAYLERHLEELLQGAEFPQKDKLIQKLNACAYWVHTLNLTRIRNSAELDLELIVKYLPVLTNLTVSYGMKSIETDELFPNDKKTEFQRQNLGIKLQEAAKLGEAIKISQNLITLQMPANMIDDDLLRFIMAGVNMNTSLVELDLSHNKIGDQGARRVAKFLMRNEILQFLDISNNQIDYDGSRYLAQALKINKTLTHLNINLNQFNDKAGMKFFKDLMINRSLEELNMAGNQLGYQTAIKLAEYLAPPCTLKFLYIGNNNFGDDCYDILRTALNTNYNLQKLDIRGCNFSKDLTNIDNSLLYEKQINSKLLSQYGQSSIERHLSEVILQKHFTKQRLHFVDEEEYYQKKKIKESQLRKEALNAKKALEEKKKLEQNEQK